MTFFDIWSSLLWVGFLILGVLAYHRARRDHGPGAGLFVATVLLGCLVILGVAMVGMRDSDGIEDAIRAEETYAQYVARWERAYEEEPSSRGAYPEVVAFTRTAVNLRSNPGPLAEVLGVLPSGTKVKAFHGLPSALPPGGHKLGDWFKVNSAGVVGWVNGRYLRPALRREAAAHFGDLGSLLRRALAPEDTTLGKILGVASGLAISVVLRFVRCPPKIELLQSVAPSAYFMARGMSQNAFTPAEAFIVMVACTLSGCVSDELASRVVRTVRA